MLVICWRRCQDRCGAKQEELSAVVQSSGPWIRSELIPQPFVPWCPSVLESQGGERGMLQHDFPGLRPQFGENSHSPLALAVPSAQSSWGLKWAWFRIWVKHQQQPLLITPPCCRSLGSYCRINTRVFVLIDTTYLGAPSWNQRVQIPSLSPSERRWASWALVVVEEHCLKYALSCLRMCSDSLVLSPPTAFCHPPTHPHMHAERVCPQERKCLWLACFLFFPKWTD